MSQRAVDQDFDRQIAMTHRRLMKAMDARMPTMSLETKERYFAVLSKLVAKLEENGKSLREVMQEMMADAMGMILQEMQGS